MAEKTEAEMRGFFPIAVALILGAATVQAAEDRLQIVDGDTVRLDGQLMRILEIDAPEIFHPRCDAEERTGRKATERLRQLVALARWVEIHPSGRIDKYGRPLVSLFVDGENATAILLREGLAVTWEPGHNAWEERRRHWCGRDR